MANAKKEKVMSNEDKPTVEIEDVVESATEPEIDISGLSEKEVEMGKTQGTIKEEKKDEHKELPKPETKEDPKAEEHPTFEDVEKDEAKLKKYNKNEQGLYFKWKVDKVKRQNSQKERDDARAEAEIEKVKHIAIKQKLDKLRENLRSGKELTTEDVLKMIGDEEKSSEELPVKKDSTEALKEKISIKAQLAEKIGTTLHEHFTEYAKLAKEVIAEDTSGDYQRLIDQAFISDDVDENMLVERIVRIAKLSDKFQTIGKSVSPEKKEEAERVIKNSEKKTSSAAVAKAGGKRVVSEDELTVAEASKLSTEQWGKLSDRTRKRILQGIDP